MIGFKCASSGTARLETAPSSFHDSFHDIEKDPFCDGSEFASGEGWLTPTALAIIAAKAASSADFHIGLGRSQ